MKKIYVDALGVLGIVILSFIGGVLLFVNTQSPDPKPIIATIHDPVLVPAPVKKVHKSRIKVATPAHVTVTPVDPLAALLSMLSDSYPVKPSFDVRRVLEYLDTNEKDVAEDAKKYPFCANDIADVLAEFEAVREKVLDTDTDPSDIEDSIDQLHSDIHALYEEESQNIV